MVLIINLNHCTHRNHIDAFKNTILEVLDKYDDFLLTDMGEGSKLWPLDDLKFDINKILYTIIRCGSNKNFTLLCSDSNIKSRISAWKKQINFDSLNIDVFNFPFTDFSEVYASGKCDRILNFMDNLNEIEKTKNFIQLTSAPKDFRLLSLDRYYKHKFFEYSYVPWFHWILSGGKKRVINSTIKDWGKKIENGFNYKKDFRVLDEIGVKAPNVRLRSRDFRALNTPELIEYEGVTYNKKEFDNFLPVQAFSVCCDIILESYFAALGPTFLTEKTWKPIIYKRPFLLLGVPGINQTLKDLNFELYDEIFDYSFDYETDDLKRLHMFWEQIDNYINLDPKIFSNKLKVLDEKLEYNRKTYFKWYEDLYTVTSEVRHIMMTGYGHTHRQYYEIKEQTFLDIKNYCGKFIHE